MTTPRLAVRQLVKHFGSTVVLRGIDLQIHPGEVHGLIGQNGAGKSTFVKILAGLYPDREGVIEVDGIPVGLRSPRDSRSEGIAVIHQEFSLVPAMTVAENLLLGREPGSWAYHPRTIMEAARELTQRVGITLGADLDDVVSSLGPAVRQRIEIVKALADDVRLLIMDEPTARLSEAERADLFTLIHELAGRQVSVIFISHYLEEVRAITDRITVLRNGVVVATVTSAQTSVEKMATHMLGENLKRVLDSESREDAADDHNEVIYEAESVSTTRGPGEVSVDVRRGEVLGIAGLVGSGRTSLLRVLAGVQQPAAGRLLLDGRPVRFAGPRNAVARGIVLIPEDRKYQALRMESSIADNLALMALQGRLGRRGFVPRRAVLGLAERMIQDLQIVPVDPDRPVGSLSGGNQQKVVLGKALAARPRVLLVDQPTAGVDIGTKEQIHALLRRLAHAGAAIVVVSDDLDELYALSDRVVALNRGRVTWKGHRADIDYPDLVHLVASGSLPEAS